MQKGKAENTVSDCNCKTERIFVFALMLIMGSLLCLALIVVFDKPEFESVKSKSKTDNQIEQIKERLLKKSKITMQPEESSIE